MGKRSDRVIAFISRYIRVPEGTHVGKPMVLEPFQTRFIRSVYDNPHGTRKAYLSIARKNGKSALIAALVIVHTVGPEAKQNSQIVCGARSRKQSSIIFELAKKMILLNPQLRELVKIIPSVKTLIGIPMNVTFESISAEATTAFGSSPSLAILDEVGQVRGPTDKFVDALTTGDGAHEDPLLIAISTQAADDADLFSIWLDDAATGGDPSIVSHVYAAPPACDLMDRAAWRAANPALGKFRALKGLAEAAAEAQRMPSAENAFRNLCLNQRVSTVSPFISKNVWTANGGAVLPFGDAQVWGGLDLSARTDLTALVLIGLVAGVWHVRPYFWTPEKGLAERARRDKAPYDVWVRQGYLQTTPGATVDYEYVAQDIAAIVSGLNLQTIAYDRWRIDLLMKEFERAEVSVPLTKFGQGFKDMSPAIDLVEADLLNSRFAHGGHPVLTMCAANAVISKDPAGNRKLDKSKTTGRIDGMVAMVMARGIVGTDIQEDAEPEYQVMILRNGK